MFSVLVSVCCIAIAIAAILVALWALDRKSGATPEPHPCEQNHKLATIDAQPAAEPSITLCLKFCGTCGNHFVVGLAGSWGIETLVRKESVVTSEIRTLEGMVR